MNKWVIEVHPGCRMIEQICEINGIISVSATGIKYLEELDSNYIRENFSELLRDEYDKGYKDGRNVTETQAHDDAHKKGVEYGRVQGQNEIWEYIKKIILYRDEGEASIIDLDKIFGCCTIQQVFRSHTAQQAIKKLKAYEEEHSNKIAIRDEVIGSAGYKGVVTGFVTEEKAYIMWDDGSCGKCEVQYLKKTGRTHDILGLLEEMKHG